MTTREWHKVPRFTDPPSEKRCSSCDSVRPAADFYENKYRNGGLSTYCKECTRERARNRWHSQSPEARRGSHRMRRFGLSRAAYDAMSATQGHLCAICRQPETTLQKGTLTSLAVDHCHATGRIRGLLCRACNTALGLLGDDPQRLVRATQYLGANGE